MPTHNEDIRYIPIMKQNITQQITAHPNHTHILCGDFNRDISLNGRQNDLNITPPQTEDTEWRAFTYSIQLSYIPTNSQYSRQGGQNYTKTSLIDGFYTNSPNNSIYTSTTNNDHNLNSDHAPVTLHIPHNKLLARQTPQTPNNTPRTLNPIPQENIEKFKTKFYEENTLSINELTKTLLNNHLSPNQWQTTCIKLEKLQKQWRKHTSTYHLIRKTIYLAKHIIQWQTHPIIETLKNYKHTSIPPLPDQHYQQQEWLITIATIAKTANKHARTITTKYT
jgi:hypothetical protein